MATQASWDDPGTDPGAGNRKAVPNATISSSMMNWILYTISMIDLPDLDGRLGNAETELQNARGSAASLDARLDAFLNEDGTPKKSQLEQDGAHELVGIVLQGSDASKPAAGVAGRFWLSTDTKAFYYDDGTQWVLIGVLAGLDLSNHGARHKAGGADAILPDTIANVLTDHNLANHTALGLEDTANKGVANGYCELDANALVPVSRIPSLTRSKISDFFGSPFWGNIPDKPSTYPPDPHTHVKADITDFPPTLHNALAGVTPTAQGTWSNVANATDVSDIDLATYAENTETSIGGDFYLQWDLGSLKEIVSIRAKHYIYVAGSSTADVKITNYIEISQDGTAWTVLSSAALAADSGTGAKSGTYNFSQILGVQARYIRFRKYAELVGSTDPTLITSQISRLYHLAVYAL